MGLAEQLREGANLVRENIPFAGSGAGSIYFGAAYSILEIEVDRPCRIRLYDDQASRDNAGEIARPYGSGSTLDSLGLIADFNIDSAGKYSTDPILYAVPQNTSTYETYYNITDNTGDVTGSLFVYKLQDESIVADVGNRFYKAENRRTLTFTSDDNQITGPRTFLMIDALADADCRLRLYGKSDSLDDINERDRGFTTASLNPELILIADMELTSGSITKFYPKIVAANLETLPSDLESIRTNRFLINSFSQVYYRLEPTGSSPEVTMNIFSLEE